MQDITCDTLKGWAMAIVAEVDPDDQFVVEDSFKATPEDWLNANPQDEGRFVGGAELSSFAAVVVPFLIGFFGDLLKDAAKDALKKAVAALLDRVLKREASADEASLLQREIDQAIARSRFTAEQKATLREGFMILFANAAANPPSKPQA